MPLSISVRVPASRAYLNAALEGLTALDVVYLSRTPRAPWLYQAGVRYRREQPRRERWLLVPEVLAQGWGDCEDLGAWRAAELRVRCNEVARAIAIRTGPRTFHTVVRRADGRIEDPSRRLGMTPEARPWSSGI